MMMIMHPSPHQMGCEVHKTVERMFFSRAAEIRVGIAGIRTNRTTLRRTDNIQTHVKKNNLIWLSAILCQCRRWANLLWTRNTSTDGREHEMNGIQPAGNNPMVADLIKICCGFRNLDVFIRIHH